MEMKKEMIFSYFDNKATILEKRRIDEWVKDPQNKELFYEYLAQWESQNIQYVSDVDAAIRRHRRRLEIVETHIVTTINVINSSKPSFRKLSIAASFLLAALIVGYFGKDKVLYKTLATSYGETKSILLEDGTKVILNANSSLSIPRLGFGDYTRNVSLKGEANFSVAHLPGNQKFVVKTADGPDIVVLGTEFTVYNRLHQFKVSLSKGKIQLKYKGNQNKKNLIMRAGELVTIDSKGKAVLKKTADPEIFSAWKDNRYVFDHTSLQDICTLFEEDFGLAIEIADPEISTWAVSGTFKASNAQELLEALAESSGLVYKKENQKVIIHSIKKLNR
jgi:ferric-dicitrate binding protein FerR (iron transport regulator)